MKKNLIFCLLPLLYSLTVQLAVSQPVRPEYGLQAFYPFEGNCNDLGPHAYHGSMYGARLAPDRFGQENMALWFGKQDFVHIPHAFEYITNKVSLAVWVKTTDDSIQTLVSKYMVSGGKGHGFMLRLEDGRAVFSGRDGSPELRSSGPSRTRVNDGIWHFLLGICRGDVWEIWVDGQKENEQYTGYQSTRLSNEVSLSLGNFPQLKQHFFTGFLDDLRLYNRPLTAPEIELLYKSGRLTAREEVEIRVNAMMKEWEKRGKFEKTADYLARVNPSTRLQKREALIQEEIQKMGMARIQPEYVEHRYDPDTEQFILDFRGFKPFAVHVPIDVAPVYDAHFQQLRFENLRFGLDELGELEILHLDLLPPGKFK
ncbi:MAG: LamG domain-containing protein [Bacteroidetes bacterium]|nr:MAG: LamG domain-containing protein [Bacteroidota bacterium]